MFGVKGVITAPTVDGTDTVISGLTDPKAIILWTCRRTAAGAFNADAQFAIGVFTYDGSAVQQWYGTFHSVDAGAASVTDRGMNTTACLKPFSGESGGAPVVDAELRGVSMDATSITLDWFNAPSGAIKVHYLVLGGSGVKARAGSFAETTAVATQDVTIVAGWGQPDLMMFATIATTAFADAAGTARLQIGFAKDETSRAMSGFWEADAAAAMTCSASQKQRACGYLGSISSFDSEFDLSARASYPTDGFEISYTNQAGVAGLICYLALQGVESAIGFNTAPTAGSPPVVQDNAAGFAPVAGIFMGWHGPALATVDTTDADLLGWFFGATDGTDEGLCALTQDDANITAVTGVAHSESKALANYTADAGTESNPPILQSEADASFSGNNLRESWNDIEASIAREHVWVAIGPAEAGGAAPLHLLASTGVGR